MNQSTHSRLPNVVALLVSAMLVGSGQAATNRPDSPAAESGGAASVRTKTVDHEGDGQIHEKQAMLPERPSHDGVATNLFAGHSWYTPPPAPVAKPVRATRASRPTAPPLPFAYLGSYEQAGVPTTYYIVRGDRVFDVIVGDIVEEKYRVDGVESNQLMFTYLPLETSQGLRLGEK